MSQQINLFDAALLRKRELLTAINLAVATLTLSLAMGGWAAYARTQLSAIEAESQVVAPQLKALQDQAAAMGQQLAEIKPSAALEADLVAARNSLSLRGDVAAALKKGVGEESIKFAEYMRGFARQSVSGLWLTGFVVGDNGEMEIHGRMNDPAQLPEYIRRLNSEKAFQGRAFAALKVSPGQVAPTNAAAAPAPVATAAAKTVPYLEFTLTPALGFAPAAANLPPAADGKPGQKLASAPAAESPVVTAPQLLANAGQATMDGKQ